MHITMSKTFMYFGYGSNLSSKRIHMNNPSAVRKCIGRLNNYRLDFGYWSKRWKGSVATIVPDEDSYVWGSVWEIDETDLASLDKQEGVPRVYEVVEVNVNTADGSSVKCRSYRLCKLPKKMSADEKVPEDRKPSLAYLNIILSGAVESGLPEDYVAQLKQIEHNGFNNITVDDIMLPD